MPREFPIHPEAHFLTNYSWEGILTIRFESDAYSKDNNFAEARRRHLIGLLMGDLRRKWGKRKKQIYWVASTEFGRSGVAHCHIIFNFHPLMHTNKKWLFTGFSGRVFGRMTNRPQVGIGHGT